MKNIIIYFLLVLLGAIMNLTSLQAQNKAQLLSFLNDLESNTSSKLHIDTLTRIPFANKASRVVWDYQIVFDGDTATYMEQVYYGSSKLGVRTICHCEAKTAVEKIQKQLEAFGLAQKGSFKISINSNDWQFFEKNCLHTDGLKETEVETRDLQELLTTSIDPTADLSIEENEYNKEIKARLLRAEDGHYILDIYGKIPEGTEMRQFAEENSMFFIKTQNGDILYPPASVPSWKAKLINQGLFDKKIVGGTDDNNWMSRNHFATYEINENTSQWNMLFHLYSAKREEDIHSVTAKAKLYATIYGDSTVDFPVPIPASAGKKYETYCDGKSVKIKELTDERRGQMTFFEDAPWVEINIVDTKGKIIANYKNGEVYPSNSFTAEAGNAYTIVAAMREMKEIEIPFLCTADLEESAVEDLTNLSKPKFMSFSLSKKNNRNYSPGLTARYKMTLPKSKKASDFKIESILDDRGNRLGQKQKFQIDSLRQAASDAMANGSYAPVINADFSDHVQFKLNTFNDEENEYDLYVHLLELPKTATKHILLKGSYTIIENENTRQEIFTDTISLWKISSITTESSIELKEHTSNAEAAKAEVLFISINSLAMSPFAQGLDLAVRFPADLSPNEAYSRVDAESSSIIYLVDDNGRDLLSGQESRFQERTDFIKKSKTNYQFDGSLNKRPYIVAYGLNDVNSEGLKTPSFSVRTYNTATSGAASIYGKAAISYFTYKKDQLKSVDIPIQIAWQEELSIPIEEHVLVYDRSSFETRSKSNGDYTTFRLINNPKINIESVVLKDENGQKISLTEDMVKYQDDYKATHITLPETNTIHVNYYLLDTKQQTLPFSIALGR